MNMKEHICSQLHTQVDNAQLPNPSWNRYLTVCQTVGRWHWHDIPPALAQGEPSETCNESPGVPPQQRGEGPGLCLHRCAEPCPPTVSPAHPSAIPAKKEQPSFQELGTSVVCLQGTHCADSLKIIPSKPIKTLHLLILQYKQAERRKKKQRH